MKNYAEVLVALQDAVGKAEAIKNFEAKHKVHNVRAMLNMSRTISPRVALALGYRRTKDGYEKLTIQK